MVWISRFRLCLLLFALSCAAAAAESQDQVTFDIPAQNLATALKAFALQSGRDVMFAPELAEKLQAGAVQGKFEVLTALVTLLNGTGLEYEITPTAAIVVHRARTVEKIRTSMTQPPKPGEVGPGEDADASYGALTGAPMGGNASIDGQVRDDATGRNLPGALVRLLQGGQTTETDRLGFFHFRGLAPGEYQISVSYLGYAERVWPATAGTDGVADLYSMSNAGSELPDVTVYGTRSARALALNQQRTAENNSEVVSSDLLGDFTGTTISEALRRVAGVSFIRDFRTGEGTNIIVRGLEPDMNAIKMNGLNLPVGDGQSRSGNLNNILADSVSKITIHKSLLPSMDSAGTGGLVEIETRSPLERPSHYVNLSAEGGRRGGDFGHDYLLSGTISRQFGSARSFGLSASGQYRKQLNQTIVSGTSPIFGEYLPLGPNGLPTIGYNDLDPRLDFPYATGADGIFNGSSQLDSMRSDTETLALTLGAAWQLSDRSLLKLDVQHSASDIGAFRGMAVAGFPSNYTIRPVAALDGEVRRALTYEGSANLFQSYTVEKRKSVTDTYSLRGSHAPGKWTFDYTAGFAHGADQTPRSQQLALGFKTNSLDQRFLLPEAVDPVEHLVMTVYPRRTDNRIPLPLLSQAGWDFLNEADNYYLNSVNDNRLAGRNDRYTAELSARRELEWGVLRNLEAGVDFERSRVQYRSSGTQGNVHSEFVSLPDPPFYEITHPSLAPLDLAFDTSDLSRIGNPGEGFNYLSESSVRSFFSQLSQFTGPGRPIDSITEITQNPLQDQTHTIERNVAAYLQSKLQIGKLEIVGGARLSSVEVQATSLYGPVLFDLAFAEDLQFRQDFSRLRSESARQNDILPRVAANYRWTDNLIMRGGYFVSTARPAIGQLSSDELITLYQAPLFGPENNEPLLQISRGNPGLRPAITDNYDLDMEYYDSHIGVIRIGGYYKRIKNLLQNNTTENVDDISGIALPDYPAFQSLDLAHTFITSGRPENSPHAATIWGLETHVERQFNFLPGFWSGFGIYANYNYARSSSYQRSSYYLPVFDATGNIIRRDPKVFELTGVPFNTQPRHTGTLALTYSGYGVDATLAYGVQGRYQSYFTINNIDAYNDAVHTLDLRSSYYFKRNGMQWRLVLEGTDLLKSTHDADLETLTAVGGDASYANSGTYLGGRALRLGLSTTF